MAIDDIWEELAMLDDDDYESRRKVFKHWESMDELKSEKPGTTPETPNMSSAIFSVAASGGAL